MPWFDAQTIDPATGSQQFPVGTHLVVAKSSARVAVKDKPTEFFLALTCEIIDGQFKGQSGVYRLNLWNANAQATEIAAKQLSALCHVTGRYQLNDMSNPCVELFNVPFRIIVQPQTDAQYTQIVGVLDANGNAPVKQTAQPAPQQQPQYQAPQPQPAQAPPAPSWGNPPQQPAPHSPGPGGAAPGWGQPAPQQQPAQAPQGQPSWSQAPAGGAQPSWGR